MGKSGQNRAKPGKTGEKQRKAEKKWGIFHKMAGGHFGSRFLPKSIGTYLYSRSVARSNMKLIGAFVMKLWSAQAFSSYFHKMAVLVFRFSPKSIGFFHSRLSMAVLNMNLIRALMWQLRETQALACGGGGGGCGGGVQTKTIIAPKFQISGI